VKWTEITEIVPFRFFPSERDVEVRKIGTKSIGIGGKNNGLGDGKFGFKYLF
jgi:hypothetical protein